MGPVGRAALSLGAVALALGHTGTAWAAEGGLGGTATWGIWMMLPVPYLVVAGIAFLIYRRRRSRR